MGYSQPEMDHDFKFVMTEEQNALCRFRFYKECQKGNVELAEQLLAKLLELSVDDLRNRMASSDSNLYFSVNEKCIKKDVSLRYAMHVACLSGAQSTVEWLLDEMGMRLIDRNTQDFLYPYQVACKHGHLELAKYLREREDPIIINAKTIFSRYESSKHASDKQMHWDLLDIRYAFFESYNTPRFEEFLKTTFTFGDALVTGENIMYLCEDDPYDGIDYHAFIEASKNGHIDVARWILSIAKIDINPDFDILFPIFKQNGDEEMLKLLVQHYSGEKLDDPEYLRLLEEIQVESLSMSLLCAKSMMLEVSEATENMYDESVITDLLPQFISPQWSLEIQ